MTRRENEEPATLVFVTHRFAHLVARNELATNDAGCRRRVNRWGEGWLGLGDLGLGGDGGEPGASGSGGGGGIGLGGGDGLMPRQKPHPLQR